MAKNDLDLDLELAKAAIENLRKEKKKWEVVEFIGVLFAAGALLNVLNKANYFELSIIVLGSLGAVRLFRREKAQITYEKELITIREKINDDP